MILIKQLLGLVDFKDNKKSTIFLSINSARFFTKNNLLSLKYDNEEIEDILSAKGLNYEFLFTGLLNYLIFIEQIGSLFFKENSIIQVIEKFFPNRFLKEELISISQFRNSFAHRFSLATQNKGIQSRKFRLDFNSNSTEKVVLEANPKWYGDFNDKTEETDTVINVKSFIQFCEEFYTKVVSENETGQLILNLSFEEIMARYTICES